MLKLERIEFKNPLKDATLRCIEYVVTHKEKVYFGDYTEPMQNFYEQSTVKHTILETRSFSDIKPHFLSYYTPLHEWEFADLVKSKTNNLDYEVQKYNKNRYLYTLEKLGGKTPYQRRSILLRYLSNDVHPNNYENIEAIREHMREITADIDYQLSSLAAKMPRLSYTRPVASRASSVDA